MEEIEVEPFSIQVDDQAIEDLKQRLLNSRYPDQLNDDNWSYGTKLEYLQSLVDYWIHEFDWKKQERAINRFNQYLINIDGLKTHFIHQRSSNQDATPIIITHGWPGSIAEFLDIIEPLTEPQKFGGQKEDAFHVVCPSLPGYAYSQAAKKPGMNTREIAKRQIKLMQALGYDSYLAQGGDWGAMITRNIADLDKEHCMAIHLNMVLAFPPDGVKDPMSVATEEEKKAWHDSEKLMEDGMGYFKIQSTRPQTLAYALNDSPLGLCAWITEKFYAWMDCDGNIENTLSKDSLLTNISLYWFSGSIGSSIRLYCEETRFPDFVAKIDVPTGAAIYPKELVRPPKKWVESSYNLIHWFKSEKGGHFAAMEQPEIFVDDLRNFKKKA